MKLTAKQEKFDSIEKQSKSINVSAKSIKGGKRSGAGRKAGVVNKRTAAVQKAVAESGITPLDYMLSLMRAESDHEDAKVQVAREALRFEAAKAAASYVHPKLAAIEHSGGLKVAGLAEVLAGLNERRSH